MAVKRFYRQEVTQGLRLDLDAGLSTSRVGNNWVDVSLYNNFLGNPTNNPLSDIPEDLISAIQEWEQDECITALIFIPLNRESLEKHYKELYKNLLDLAQSEDDGLGDDTYFDYVPNAFEILEWILFGLAHTYEDPACAFDALKVHYNHYDLIKAYAKFSDNSYSSDDILSLISPHSYSEMIQFKEDVQIHTI